MSPLLLSLPTVPALSLYCPCPPGNRDSKGQHRDSRNPLLSLPTSASASRTSRCRDSRDSNSQLHLFMRVFTCSHVKSEHVKRERCRELLSLHALLSLQAVAP